jgi:SpoU rRNA methylase family enzyme
MSEIFIALYAPSSVQKLLDFVKTVYVSPRLVPVIIKPYGAAAQVGIPEAYKISYKLGRPLIVLPEAKDLVDVLTCKRVYYLDESGSQLDLSSIISSSEKTAIIIPSGEQEPAPREISSTHVVWPSEIPRGLPPVAIAGVIVYEIVRQGILK